MKKLLYLFLCMPIYSACNQKTFLIFGGKTGWIGTKLVTIINDMGHKAVPAQSRLENRKDISQELHNIKPDYIINAAGVIGTPNVDWTEDHPQETIRSNILGALNLVDISFLHNIHCTTIGTGCIYSYDTKHPLGSGIGFIESETPNFEDAMYCKTKIMLEKLLSYYPNSLYLRVRLPLSFDAHPRNLLYKLTKYKKVVNIPNSITVLDTMLPLIPQMCFKQCKGVYNFTNPGTISHNELLNAYKEIVNPSFSYVNFTLEEQNTILKVNRCYNELDISKLQALLPDLVEIHTAVRQVLEMMPKKAFKS